MMMMPQEEYLQVPPFQVEGPDAPALQDKETVFT